MSSNWQLIGKLMPQALLDTLIMVGFSSFFALLIGLPIGIFLYSTSRGGLYQNPWLHSPASFLVDCLRAIPFLILAAYLIPVTRIVVGKIYGNPAMVFVLSISAIPFYARMAELSLRSVDKSLIDAIRAMGATRLQTIREVIIPEALPSLATGFTVTVIAIIAASAMAGFVGSGGLGQIALSYGYQRYVLAIMQAAIVLLVALNMSVQWFGDYMARKLDHTERH